MRYYFFILAAVALLALQFSTNKAYGLRRGDGAKASLIFGTACGFASALITFVIACLSEGGFQFTPFSLLMGAVMASLSCAYTLIGFRILALGDMSVFMMFLMLGGMMLPYIFGVTVLGEFRGAEPWRIALRVFGLVLLTVSMVFPVFARKKAGRGSGLFVALCAAVFVLNGVASIVSKTHQTAGFWPYPSVNAPSYACLGNLMNGVISAVCLAVVVLGQKRRSAEEGEPDPRAAEKAKSLLPATTGTIALIIAANALCNGVSYTLQLVSASKLPASVLYPMVTGGSVVLSAVAGRIFFGEKPDRITLFGLILSFAATFFFLF
ncbi:MAG: hypothetical protein II953_00165 [Clostridia bacterium]|nr:hypothetical protein [Clostridia bacterium]MBQ5354707.1 hypothetical protein [Clostridia bacterium]